MTQRSLAIAVALVCVSCAAPSNFLGSKRLSHADVGVLVLAHGGSRSWDGVVRQTVRQAQLPVPTQVVFGMGMHPGELTKMQQAVERLQQQGVQRIVVIPLLVSSHSEVFRQYEYLFGIRQQAEWPEAGKPLRRRVPIVMGVALDDHPVIAESLLERAARISREPGNETVVLVAHGPNGDVDNERWLGAMQHLADLMKQRAGFRQVVSLTMRDDAPAPLKAQAETQFRQTVMTAGQQGRVLVLPLLLAKGGVEQKVPKILAGIPCTIARETLLPHPKLAQWVAAQAGRLAAAPSSATTIQKVDVPPLTIETEGRLASSQGSSTVVK